MKRLETQFMGLTLQSPIIVSSSPFTSTLEGIKKAAAAGAGAVVLKSIFEEQIIGQGHTLDIYSDYPEASDYIQGYLSENLLDKYENLIRDAKKETIIPIIASINCSNKATWTDFASRIEKAGADAIELNIFKLPSSKDESSTDIENDFLEIASSVKSITTLPVSVKLSGQFTNPLAIVKELYYRGIKSVVLFNRFYSPDINIDKISMSSGGVWSDPSEIHNVIRWSGMISSAVPLVDISTSTGIRTGEDAIKMILSGARTVQICSTINENGFSVISEINNFIKDWITQHSFTNTRDFIGKLSFTNSNSNAYERVQFMKYFSQHK